LKGLFVLFSQRLSGKNIIKKLQGMLQIGFIKDNRELVLAGLQKKHFPNPALVDEALEQDEARRSVQKQLDDTLANINQLSKGIGQLMKQGKTAEAEAAKSQVAALKEAAKPLEARMAAAAEAIEAALIQLPNIPNPLVPFGKTAEDNELFKAWNRPMPPLHPGKLPHWELAKQYNLFDLELGVQITGAGFPLYRGKGARLQRALISFFLDQAAKAGYEEIQPPILVNEASARATGQLPDKEGQMYFAPEDNLYLIPTAEVPITNIYRDAILEEKDFPIKMCGYTPCFRREAGSYGAHVRGLNRVHQFDKVEIVRIEKPENSYAALDEMLAHVSSLLDQLELPYRILRLCGGDMSFASALTYDFEVFSAAQERWLEVSSVSNFETFQSNRMKLRYKADGNAKALAHTLNGSALALARIVAALLENNQTTDGINIPKVLWQYTGFEKI
jgi:seryl-tRNA synthetase